MLIFALIILVLSVISLICTIVDTKSFKELIEILFGIVSLIFGIAGSIWYIFNLTILPYDFVIGIALGSAALCFISLFSLVLKKQLSFFHLFNITTMLSVIFFALVFVFRAYPHLLSFLPF